MRVWETVGVLGRVLGTAMDGIEPNKGLNK